MAQLGVIVGQIGPFVSVLTTKRKISLASIDRRVDASHDIGIVIVTALGPLAGSSLHVFQSSMENGSCPDK